jgi:hypothetical protein
MSLSQKEFNKVIREDLPKNGYCPYCDWKAPSWLSHKVMSLSKHIIHNHKEHYGYIQKDRWAGHEKKLYTKTDLSKAKKQERARIVGIVEGKKLSEIIVNNSPLTNDELRLRMSWVNSALDDILKAIK